MKTRLFSIATGDFENSGCACNIRLQATDKERALEKAREFLKTMAEDSAPVYTDFGNSAARIEFSTFINPDLLNISHVTEVRVA